MRITGLTFKGIFIKRLNRFLALVKLDGREEFCHIRDPGRLTEVLTKNSSVIVRLVNDERRKTMFELIAVRKNDIWVVVNSGLHNKLSEELITSGKIGELSEFKILRREWRYKRNRFDFLLSNKYKCILEVKGCTLVKNGLALFPDAPTKRGAKQLSTLLTAMKEGFKAALLILVMRRDAEAFSPNVNLDPYFSKIFKLFLLNGAIVIVYSFNFDGIEIRPCRRIPVKLVKDFSIKI